MNRARLPPDLRISNGEGCEADGSAAEEGQGEGEAVGLRLADEGGGEVSASTGEDAGCYVSAVRYGADAPRLG